MRSLHRMCLTATVLALSASSAFAQGGPGGGPGGGGGGGFAAFQKFREQHKYTFQLTSTLTRGLMECQRSKSTELKPDQAKKILAVIEPLKKQPKLTQDQAKATLQKLQK